MFNRDIQLLQDDFILVSDPLPICLCGKKCFPSKKTARTAANKLERNGNAKVIRVYHCSESGTDCWHVSNQDRYTEWYSQRNRPYRRQREIVEYDDDGDDTP